MDGSPLDLFIFTNINLNNGDPFYGDRGDPRRTNADCASFKWEDGKLLDNNCDNELPYICEIVS